MSDIYLWPYDPSFALAVLATVLYGVTWLWLSYLTIIRYRAWYFSVMVFACMAEVAGYALRSVSIKKPYDLAPFVVTSFLVVLVPVFIAAGNYLLIGRLIRACLPASRHRVLGIPARLVARVFILCDVVSCLVQGSGSSTASSVGWVGPTADVGVYVLIAGLAFQAATLAYFLSIMVRFHVLAGRSAVPTAPPGWRLVTRAVYVSSFLVMIRSIYRVVEFAEGIDGYAFTHEWLFWVFECLPMLIAIAIFCLYHPSKYLGRTGGKGVYYGGGGGAESMAEELSDQPVVRQQG